MLSPQRYHEVPKPAPADVDQPASVLVLLGGHLVEDGSASRKVSG
jgi:hypothetical protein